VRTQRHHDCVNSAGCIESAQLDISSMRIERATARGLHSRIRRVREHGLHDGSKVLARARQRNELHTVRRSSLQHQPQRLLACIPQRLIRCAVCAQRRLQHLNSARSLRQGHILLRSEQRVIKRGTAAALDLNLVGMRAEHMKHRFHNAKLASAQRQIRRCTYDVAERPAGTNRQVGLRAGTQHRAQRLEGASVSRSLRRVHVFEANVCKRVAHVHVQARSRFLGTQRRHHQLQRAGSNGCSAVGLVAGHIGQCAEGRDLHIGVFRVGTQQREHRLHAACSACLHAVRHWTKASSQVCQCGTCKRRQLCIRVVSIDHRH
jgi:hypothetical protein